MTSYPSESSAQHLNPHQLDIPALARAGAVVQGRDTLVDYPRLREELAPEAGAATAVDIVWRAQGAHIRPPAGVGAGQDWLHLEAQATLAMTCQMCLSPVQVPLHVRRSFRFAPDEASAAAQDEECEEDVLVSSRTFDLHELVEDELLMELPLVPQHERCPQELPHTAVSPDWSGDAAQQARANPFAVLQSLRTPEADDGPVKGPVDGEGERD